ncbi:MAG: J domain-containing protein [Ilumatobacteraceae bacterium]
MPGTERGDPHRILGVRPGSSQREVRDAYRRLANELHPDRSGASGAARMAEVNEAYRTLRSGGSATTTTRTTAAGASEWYAGEAGRRLHPGSRWARACAVAVDAGVRRRSDRSPSSSLRSSSPIPSRDAPTTCCHPGRASRS